MYLKSLTLRGFKSFAERTVLRFEPGITAIVGPNGSGKSNISDSVIWVLGEQSPRSLRSGSMEDVIFAGSSARPALGVAEVSLSLSNTDGLLPIEFSEVTITRRLFRSGESDYFINNAPCRLLDIQELLYDSGLGKGLYSIIGQGRLEEILNSKPEEKRLLIEDAAGILKYKKRKERALRKLKSMDQNLQRAKDISQEINRQLKPLKNQASKAQEYIALSNRLRTLDIGLAIMDLKELQGDWEVTASTETSLKAQLAEKKDALSKRQAVLEELQLELETKNIYSNDMSGKRLKLQSVEEKIHSNISLLTEKHKNLRQRINEVSHNILQAEQRKKHLLEQQDWLEREKTALSMQTNKIRTDLAKFEKDLQQMRQKRQEAEETTGALKEIIQKESRLTDDYQNKINNLRLDIQTNENQVSFLKNELQTLIKRRSSLHERAEQKKRDSELVSIELTRLDFQLTDLNTLLGQLENELGLKQGEENELMQDQAALKARIKAVEEIIGSYPSAENIKKSLSEADVPNIIGLIKDAIRVKPEYERCIEAVLGDDVFCMIFENSNSLNKIANLKTGNSLGLTSFMSSDRARFKLPNSKLAPATWALDVVSYPDNFSFAVSALLSHVYIVPDFDTAIPLQEKADSEIIVTLDGEVFLPNGKVVLGTTGDINGILAYQRELQELCNTLKELEAKIEKAKEVKTELAQRIEKFYAQKNGIWAKLQAKKVEHSNLKHSLEDIEPEFSKLVLQEDALSKKINGIELKLQKDNEEILQIKKNAKSQKEKQDSILFEHEDLLKTRDRYLEEESRLQVEVGRLRLESDTLNDKIMNGSRRSTSIARELDNFDNEVEKEKGYLNYLEMVSNNAAPLRTVLEQLLSSITFRREQIDKITSSQEDSLDSIRQSLRQNQFETGKLSDQIETIVQQIHEAQLNRTQLELKVTAAVEKVVDEYNVPLEKALEHEIQISAEEAETEASSLRRRMAMLGPINPIAVEEYSQLEERYKFFIEQIEDLQRSKRALMRVMGAIEQKMKSRFIETFDKVNESFQSIFELLFPGGHAELILTDPDNMQASGIDIIAQPGGKKLQRLSLLSGGEKSLVALAFSFALYQTKPSPFYILDEVEAALDDINLKRFIALLNKIKENSQVLIVTHQRRTMEIADSLYGISMQADGVSRLISQKFNEVVVGVG